MPAALNNGVIPLESRLTRRNPTAVHRLRALLENVWASMVRHPTFFRRSGSLPDDASFVADQNMIAKLQSRLTETRTLFEKDLAGFDFREQIAFRSPRDQSYRALQSYRDKRMKTRDFYEFAINSESELQELRGKNSSVSMVGHVTRHGERQPDFVKVILEHRCQLSRVVSDLHAAVTFLLDMIISLLIGHLLVAASMKNTSGGLLAF